MIINPKKIINEWILTNIENSKEQIQQNWVDITLKYIDIIHWFSNILIKKERKHADRSALDFSKNEIYLKPWIYDILFNEEINIPNWMCANIYTRSTLNRSWNFITSGLYDAGYKWVLWAILHINIPITLEKGVRLAQIVFSKAEKWDLYDWIYNTKQIA